MICGRRRLGRDGPGAISGWGDSAAATLPPSNLTGANGFAGQDHCSRVCGAEHRRAAGAPLTVILNGKKSSAPLDRPPAPIGLARCRRPRNGEQPNTQGSGASRPASAAVPRQRPRARGSTAQPTPRARADPPIPRGGPGGHARAPARIPLRHFASPTLDPCAGSSRSRRAEGAPFEAVQSGRIRSNPARGLGLPRPKRRDYVFLTHGQVSEGRLRR